MANRYFQQFWFSLIHSPVFLEGNFTVGASGAVRTVKGSGIKAVTKLYTGCYRIDLDDSYHRYLSGKSGCAMPYSGSNVAAGALSTNGVYMITVVGTTDWSAVGLPVGVTAKVGSCFVATGTGTGSGYAMIVSSSGVANIEVAGNPSITVADQKLPHIVIQCLDYADAAVNPVENTTVGFFMILRNSSITGKGE